MAQSLEAALGERLERALRALGIDPAGSRIELRPSAKPEFGDLSTPVALALGKRLGRKSLDLAGELAEEMRREPPAHVRRITVSPPGFVNFFIDEASYADALAGAVLAEGDRYGLAAADAPAGTKLVIEHTNINSNKAAHVGHLRNACLGDTVARLLRATGREVEVQNYIDDTGVQVADVVVALRTLGWTYDESEPFDYFCSRLYAEIQRRYDQEPELKRWREEVLREIERRDSDTARETKELALRIVARHLGTMARVGVAYDLLTWESDILALGFWRHAFAMLRQRDLLEHPGEGPNAGTWVVPFGEGEVETEAGRRSQDKVLVKSDGVVTYTGKDLAYQLWKFGLLGLDFGYRPWGEQWNRQELWTSTNDPAEGPHDRFGHAGRVINVIDVRQSYPQEVVYESLRRLGFVEQADNSVHLAYEVVALSAEAARALGVATEEGKQTYAFSGRKGIEVKADDLLNLARERMTAKLAEQQAAGRGKSADSGVAEALAAGAVRYYLLKFGLTQIIPFDFDEALRHTGDTGVYLQYAYARACNVLQRAGAPAPAAVTAASPSGSVPATVTPRVPPAPSAHDAAPAELDLAALQASLQQPGPGLPAAILPADKALALALGRLPSVVAEAAERLAPAILARYAFELATAFSDFYEHTPPLYREPDPALRRFRLRLVAAFRQTFRNTLTLLGIPPLEAI